MQTITITQIRTRLDLASPLISESQDIILTQQVGDYSAGEYSLAVFLHGSLVSQTDLTLTAGVLTGTIPLDTLSLSSETEPASVTLCLVDSNTGKVLAAGTAVVLPVNESSLEEHSSSSVSSASSGSSESSSVSSISSVSSVSSASSGSSDSSSPSSVSSASSGSSGSSLSTDLSESSQSSSISETSSSPEA